MRADGTGELHGPADVLDDRDVPQDRAALRGEQRGPDHGQYCVLRALDECGATEDVPTANAVTNHVLRLLDTGM
ncbi:hypothetical protein GCM10010106_13600 [Thermopolyspora flexuosa]|nr:hypothetical protein GCM10010106_13600 [Thermopolyspora flexuosa]